jgi:hypothetical protein
MLGKFASLIVFLILCVSIGNAQQDKASKTKIGRSYRIAGEKLEVQERPDVLSRSSHLGHNEIFTIINKADFYFRIRTKAGKELFLRGSVLNLAENLGQVKDIANEKMLSGFKELSFGSSIAQVKKILQSGYKEICSDKINCDGALDGDVHSYFDLPNVSRALKFELSFFNDIGLYSIGIAYSDSDKHQIKRVLNIRYGETTRKGELYRDWDFWDFPNASIKLWDAAGPQMILLFELKQGDKIRATRKETAAQKAAKGLR